MLSKKYTSLLFLAFINTVGIALPYPVLSPMIIDGMIPTILNLSPMMTVMLVLSLYPLGQFVGSPFIGAYSDKLGSRRVVMYSMILTGFGYLSSAVALIYSNIYLLCLSRFITGFVEGNFGVIRAEVARMFPAPEQKVKGFGFLNSSAGLGWIFGPIIGGTLSNQEIHSSLSYHSPFIFGALLAFIGVSLAAYSIKEGSKEERVKASVFDSIKTVWSFPSITLLLFSLFFITLAIDGFYEYYPAFIAGFLKQGPEAITSNTTVLAISIIFSQVALIPLFGSIKNLAFLASALFFGLSMLGLIKEIAYAPYIVSGLGIGIMMTVAPTIISEKTPKNLQGTVMGLLASLRNLGDFIVCISFGFLADINYYIPLVMIAIIIIIASYKFIKYSSLQQEATHAI